jgi:hypothetical protein
MKPVHNYVSKILHETNGASYDILTYIDFAGCLTDDRIQTLFQTIVEKNTVLRQYIVKDYNGEYYLKDDATFALSDYLTIQNAEFDTFDSPISEMLNKPLETNCKWRARMLRDESKNRMRLFFTIDHAYADGYQVIKILTSAWTTENLTDKFNRTTTTFRDTLYYFIFGTLNLLVLNISFFTSVLFNPKPPLANEILTANTDFFVCKSLDFHKIKQFTKQNGWTINDFLYAMMIKTDYLYTKKQRIVHSSSPMNTSKLSDLNNLTPLILRVENSLTNRELIQTVHEIFNSCKYSLFIPGLSRLIRMLTPHLSIEFMTTCYEKFIHQSDYVYSNIIGPECKDFEIPITDIHFITTAKDRAIMFNLISYGDSINLICSFKNGIVKDKDRLQACILEAYTDLLHNTVEC